MNKTVHDQISMFNIKLKNIFSNYIPNKYVTIDDKDSTWMAKAIKDKNDFEKYLFKSKFLLNCKNSQHKFLI